jgi:outer membrane protein OmpA-like peptidoglycan-associated protein
MDNNNRRLVGIFLVSLCVQIFGSMQLSVYAQDNKTAEAWLKYEFIPGHQLLYYDDFSGDLVGETPQAWELISGMVEVVEFENQRWLRAVNESIVAPVMTALPAQFTLEMDFYVTPRGYSGNYRIDIYGATDDDWAALTLEDLGAYLNTSSGLSLEHALELKGRHRVAVMVDGAGFECYVDSLRVINVPKTGNFQPTSLEIFMPGGDEEGDDKCLISNFRLARAGKKFREQISEQGKIVSYGVSFVKGSTTLKPSSTPTLKEVAALLQTDATLNLSIECHDYELPDAGDNARLSQQRAEALKETLINLYKVRRDRLSTRGWGASRQLEDDDTVLGHAMNSRVEFVKK